MRVISGRAKHMPLKTIEGDATRPTTDRIKETLFNMLQHEIYGCRFLDLFAGSGGIGIEALSRGAKEVFFVEHNPKAVACIRENLAFTHLEDGARVITGDVFAVLAKLEGEEAFDIIFMDPPYHLLAERKVLEKLAESSCISEDTLIVTEASIKTKFDYLQELGFEIIKYKKYKTNAHVFIKKVGGQKTYEKSCISGKF